MNAHYLYVLFKQFVAWVIHEHIVIVLMLLNGKKTNVIVHRTDK